MTQTGSEQQRNVMSEKALFSKPDWPLCSTSLPVTYPCSLLWVNLRNSSKLKAEEPNAVTAFPPDSFVHHCFTLQALLWARGNAPCSSPAWHLLSPHSDTCGHRQPHSHPLSCSTTDSQLPLAHGLNSSVLHSNPKHTHAQRIESTHPGKQWEIEFNEMAEQTMLTGQKAWPDKCTGQQTVHRKLSPYILLHSLRLLLPASHNEFHSPGQRIPQKVCSVPQRATSLGTHNAESRLTCGVDAPGTALGGWDWHSRLWLGLWDSPTAPCPHTPLCGKRWAFSTYSNKHQHHQWEAFWLILNQNRSMPCGHLFFSTYTAEIKRKFIKGLTTLSLLWRIMFWSGKRRPERKDLSFAQMHPHKLEAVAVLGGQPGTANCWPMPLDKRVSCGTSCGGRALDHPVIMNICEVVHENLSSLFPCAQFPAPKLMLLCVPGYTPKHCLAEMEKWS